jgi:hypothetical protein
MSLQGPFVLRLVFHVFVVVVGTMILSGAVNTAIVGSNGVLNRVSEDGVLSDWFRQPHPKFGTSHRIINMIVVLQIVTIVISRGDVTFLANLYAFGVIWSFALKGIAVLVLRYTHPQEREFRVPLNFTIAGKEIPVGLALITLTLLGIAIVNLFTKPAATISGVTFSGLLFLAFELSEKRIQRKRGQTHVELDQFNLAQAAELTPEAVGREAGQHPGAGEHLLRALSIWKRRCGARNEGKRKSWCCTCACCGAPLGGIRSRPGSALQHHRAAALHEGSVDRRKGGQARPALGGRGETICGKASSAPRNLQSSAIVLGSSAKQPVTEQAREIGIAWERLQPPRPQVNLEIFTPSGQEQVFYLGPHAPRLTPKEIDLLHKIWLQLSDKLPGQEIHHHDIVHFALDEVERELENGQEPEVLERLRDHLREIRDRRLNP